MRRFTLSLALLSLVGSAVAYATECRLERPIPFSGSILTERWLDRVVTDQVPKFKRPANYDPARDELEIGLFQTEYEGEVTGWLGSRIAVKNKREWVGFTNWYRGPTAMEGRTTSADGVRTYWSRITFYWVDTPNLAAIYELSVGTRGSEIVSIALTHPVMEVTEVDGNVTYTRFTGENQRLCVLSAR
jgi:hypothetical protein